MASRTRIEMFVALFLIASFVLSGVDAQSDGSVDAQGNIIVDMIKDIGNHILGGNNTDGDINILASKRPPEISKPRFNKKLKSDSKKKIHKVVAQATGSNWCTLHDIRDENPCKVGYRPRAYCNPCSPGHGPPRPVAVADEGAGIMHTCACGDTTKCLETCSRYDTIFDTDCTLLYPGGAKQEGCTRNAQICREKKFDLAVVWADFLTNLIPYGKLRKTLLKKGAKKYLKNELRKEARKALRELKNEFFNDLREVIEDNSLLTENAFNSVFMEMNMQEAAREAKLNDEERGYFESALKELEEFVMPLDYEELRRITDGPECSQIVTLDKSDIEWERPSGGLENVAFSKPTSQSSTYGIADSKLAVDGDLNGDYYGDSVTHTNAENGKSSWWKVDLQGSYRIKYIHIYNRDDCCQDRLNGLLVEIKDNGTSVWTQRPNINSNYETIISFGSSPMIGDEVILSVPSNTYLSLAEVEVIAEEKSQGGGQQPSPAPGPCTPPGPCGSTSYGHTSEKCKNCCSGKNSCTSGGATGCYLKCD